MLDKLNLDVTMTKEAYREEIKPLKERLAVLQHEVKNNGLPVMVIFEGWSAAGKAASGSCGGALVRGAHGSAARKRECRRRAGGAHRAHRPPKRVGNAGHAPP